MRILGFAKEEGGGVGRRGSSCRDSKLLKVVIDQDLSLTFNFLQQVAAVPGDEFHNVSCIFCSYLHVLFARVGTRERLVAEGAEERTDAGVFAHVHLEVLASGEGRTA